MLSDFVAFTLINFSKNAEVCRARISSQIFTRARPRGVLLKTCSSFFYA
jgi:hypothetical protein